MTEQKFFRFPTILTIAYLIVGIGSLLQISAGHWDVIWHDLQNPETFFTPPHSVMYLGVLLTLLMGIMGIALRVTRKYEIAYVKFLQYAMIGTGLQLFAGGFDSWWHTNFGFDGLLSPPHLILVAGMILNSLAALLGAIRMSTIKVNLTARVAAIISLTALWMSSIGMIMLFSLPFSRGQTFDFNPNPSVGAATATIGMPLIGALMISLAYKNLRIQFPVTVLTSVYVSVYGMATIVSHYALAPFMPYYLLVLLPAVAVDFVLRSKASERIKVAIGGMIFAVFFYFLYFPLVPHAFREILGKPEGINTIILFLETCQAVMTWTILPAIVLGLTGALLADKISRMMKPK